jgi:hypothetical protein
MKNILEDGTDRVLRNVGIQNSDAGELPSRKHKSLLLHCFISATVDLHSDINLPRGCNFLKDASVLQLQVLEYSQIHRRCFWKKIIYNLLTLTEAITGKIVYCLRDLTFLCCDAI